MNHSKCDWAELLFWQHLHLRREAWPTGCSWKVLPCEFPPVSNSCISEKKTCSRKMYVNGLILAPFLPKTRTTPSLFGVPATSATTSRTWRWLTTSANSLSCQEPLNARTQRQRRDQRKRTGAQICGLVWETLLCSSKEGASGPIHRVFAALVELHEWKWALWKLSQRHYVPEGLVGRFCNTKKPWSTCWVHVGSRMKVMRANRNMHICHRQSL